MIEVWKDIEGYEGLYQVSNLGRVKSLERINRRGCVVKEKILKLGICKNGHNKDRCNVSLWKDNKGSSQLISRLVAKAFIPNPNPEKFDQVNHINEIKTDNRVENLEWCDGKYNMNYGTRTKRVSENNSKPVIQYSLNGEFIAEYKSAIDAKEKTGISNAHIGKCCKNKPKYKTAGGYIWKFKNEEDYPKMTGALDWSGTTETQL